ncbi:MAG TPA: ATP-binding protein [Streptosporangiaceae bacterium]
MDSGHHSAEFLLQLAGAPASGKSQLAAAIIGHAPAVIVNSDVVKSTLLDAGIEWKLAGPAAYQTLFALADDFLGQGHSVILDSPSHYAYIPENGERIARQHGVPYRFIELICEDLDELRRRMAQRTPRRSQMPGLDQPPPDSGPNFSGATRTGTHQWHTYGPAEGHLTLDTAEPFEKYLQQALDYLGVRELSGAGTFPPSPGRTGNRRRPAQARRTGPRPGRRCVQARFR